MGHYTGKGGRLSIEATPIVGALAWTVNEEGDAVNATDFDDTGVEDYVPGNTRWSGSAEINFDDTQDVSANPPNVNVGEVISFEGFIDVIAGLSLSGDAIITGFDTVVNQPDLTTFSISFQGKGALTKDLVPV